MQKRYSTPKKGSHVNVTPISEQDRESYDGMCWECWDDQLTEESDSMFDDLMQGRDIVLWPCPYCGHENSEELSVCENCGTLRFDEIGDSGDNKDPEDLFFDDEGI